MACKVKQARACRACVRVRREKKRVAAHLHIIVDCGRFVRLRRPLAVEEDLLGDVEVRGRVFDEFLEVLREKGLLNVLPEVVIFALNFDRPHFKERVRALLHDEHVEHRLRTVEQQPLDCTVGLAVGDQIVELRHVDLETMVDIHRSSSRQYGELAGVSKTRHLRHVPACPAARRKGR